MRHDVLIRSAYGPGWDLAANRRRLALTEGVTVRSLRSQTSQAFRTVVLLHREDPLLEQRQAVFGKRGAWFIYIDDDGSPSEVAYRAYQADWAIGERNEVIVQTRLDDDDAFAPWAMAKIAAMAEKVQRRTILMFPLGIRVWDGGYTLVRHMTNAMHTLVTPPGDALTVYGYGHRKLRSVAPVITIDNRPAWLWSRHPDTISGWRSSDRPLTPDIRALFDVDWDLFGESRKQPRVAGMAGHVFR